MKNVIIVAPHFPPSNLAGVHRSRLFAMHLPAFGWNPIVVTVDERYYEEEPDHELTKLLPGGLRVEKVQALPVRPVKIVGDIGIRAFLSLLKKVLAIVRNERIDFLYIPIPSNYASLIGRIVHERTGVPYGIDYIDPWVHHWPGTNSRFSKAWFTRQLSILLEPIAVKKASVITGVAEGYYTDVFSRNPHLTDRCISAAMPYGGEALDHEKVGHVNKKPYLFSKDENKVDLVYAGAMLPKAYAPLNAIFQAMVGNRQLFSSFRFHFIGTGKSPNDPRGFNIRPMAEQYGLWNDIVFEYPKRIPYLDVLVHLEAADGVFILGSTEAHYTPSKVYQGVLSGKPILAVLHEASSACQVITASEAGVVLSFNGENGVDKIRDTFSATFADFTKLVGNFDPSSVRMDAFEKYSAKAVTATLATVLDSAVGSL